MRALPALVVLVVACAGSEPAPEAEPMRESGSESESESDSEVGSRESESEPESEVGSRESESEVGSRESESDPRPSEPPPECATARDCTLLTDSCGNPHGAPNGSPPLPTRGRICPPNEDPPREPVCRHGQCQTQEASHPEARGCEADSECVVARAVCGVPIAVNRAKKQAFEREQRNMERRVRCRQQEHPQNLRTACLVSLCVLR